MKLAIMQPYFFPYLGYFQLINAVDCFVIYDDVDYIKGGWINKNFLLAQGKKSRFTLQLSGASSNSPINKVHLGNNKNKLLKSIAQNYSQAPHFQSVFPKIKDIILFNEPNLGRYLTNSLKQICTLLEITPTWYLSSELNKNNDLHGQDKILSISRLLNACNYINLPGGRALYDPVRFSDLGITLSFITPTLREYPQFNSSFISNLSIIDVLMFNDAEQCSALLQSFELANS